MIRNYGDLTTKEMVELDKDKTVILLPLGATEQHGPQAPLGTDTLIAQTLPQYIQEELIKVAPDYDMLVLEALPIGLSIEHQEFNGTITLSPQTYYNMLAEIVTSLSRH